MAEITIHPFKKKLTLKNNETVLEALRRSGYTIEGPCNGEGICGKCKIRVENPESVPETPHKYISNSDARSRGIRLACRLIPETDSTIHLPEDYTIDARILEGKHITGIDVKPAAVIVNENGIYKLHYAGESAPVVLECWQPDYSPKGLALDIGTTTLVATLFCLRTGEELATASGINPQTQFGHDILSRIQKGSTKAGLAELAKVVRDEINGLIGKACARSNAVHHEVVDVVIGGNTTMLELVAEINPEPLGHLPFTVGITGGASYNTEDFGFDINPAGRVYVPPIAHAFVGTDITAGILACGCLEKKDPILFIDIGTNGEMGINNGDRFIVTSTAAGPAFEGMGISCGIRAIAGAVEAAYVNGDMLKVKTIGDKPPKGICGSGIIDIVACLLKTNIIDHSGRMKAPPGMDKVSSAMDDRLKLVNDSLRFQVADDVYFTQSDVRQLQLAKGAIRTGVDMLIQEADLSSEDLKEVALAGAFGYHLRPESLETVGLLPKGMAKKVLFVGNTSKTGCAMMLLNMTLRGYLENKTKNIRHLPLAEKLSFQDLFIENLGFPVQDKNIRRKQ